MKIFLPILSHNLWEDLGAEIKNFELQKFKVFCLVQSKENRKALAYLELMKEAGFKDDFFVQKINYLLGMLLAKKERVIQILF